jgi:photosystem II stability/assembly factor-like uncharacterized protein
MMRKLIAFIWLTAMTVACMPAPAAAPTSALPAPATPQLYSATPPLTIAEPTQPMPTVAALVAISQPAAAAHFRLGDSIQLDTMRMINRTDGWGIRGAYVLTTADGGQTWREVTPPDGPADQAYGSFLDKQTAWILFAANDHIPPEARVWHTTDGGSTWTASAPLMHQISGDRVWAEFAFLDPQNAWMMVRGVYVGAGIHYNHQLFQTTDGGLNWNSLDSETSADYTGMVFANPRVGLRTLQTTGPYASAPPAYDVTPDGGATWEGRELPPPPENPDLFSQYPYCETYQPIMLAAQAIRMLVGCFDYADPPKQFVSYFYTSQDGGATWTTILLPDKVQAAQSNLIYFGLNNILLLGRDMYLSTSDGQTWDYIKTVNWDGQFSFSDPQYGWAIARANGEMALVQTTDWAKTWTVIKPVIAP